MLRKLIPFLSLLLFAGTALAAEGPPSGQHSYSQRAKASGSAKHGRHHRHHRHTRHPH
jgi:hypothetical protein